MGQSYRIRTEVGVDKTINLQLDQDFEFLEILSLKIQQADVYTRYCADYGVVVGRVTANNGTGVPNAKISVFIPASEQDLLNQELRSIYPYTSIEDTNEDGYRYNLLPYEKSYSKHAATGTFPTRLDVLTNATAAEIYDKYFKFTVKTNESGDYMIMGVPLGFQTVVMDVDLSDIGEFSLTPQDLIRIGRATEAQVSGGSFRTSTDLNSLPQIVNLTKTVEVSPLWGEPEICQIAINRVDFDLREDANIDIQPTSVFIGSIFSNSDEYRVRKNCKPRDNTGELCSLQSGPGQILAVRQTIQQDSDGNPILEQYQLEQSGNVIDEDGTWVTELPMNLDYITTNEFGERVISPDPNVGIPTKANYRFKIKWQQAKGLSQQTRRADFLVPNVREYGWLANTTADPYLTQPSFSSRYKQLRSSYYFGLDWSGYTNGFGSDTNKKLDSIINCEDTFYEFRFNKVYTVSGLIDQYKKGNRARFIGIKEIGNNDCAATVNKFPVNEGYRNFDTLFFIFSILFTIFQYIGSFLLVLAHVIIGTIYQIINLLRNIIGGRPRTGGIPVRLPMITYPECQSCDCKPAETSTTLIDTTGNGVLTPVSSPVKYYEKFTEYLYGINYQPAEDITIIADLYSQAMGGNISSGVDTVYKVPKSDVLREVSEGEDKMFVWSMDLPIGERVNLFNQRNSYFSGINRIRVSFDHESNVGLSHLDNTITVISTRSYLPGQLLTTVNPGTTSDKNVLYEEVTNNGTLFGISGTSITQAQQITVKYANENNQTLEKTSTYNLTTGSTFNRQYFPIDREYFQVITAITVNEFISLANLNSVQTFPDILTAETVLRWMEHNNGIQYRERSVPTRIFGFNDFYENFDNQYILILQRGVDPYSPKFKNKYNLGKIFGYDVDDSRFSFLLEARINIPIQKVTPNSTVQQFNNQNNIFYNSYFFTPGTQFSAFTSSSVGYYGKLDVSNYSVYNSNVNNDPFYGANGISSKSANDFYSNTVSSGKYDDSEDLSGNAILDGELNRTSALAFLTPIFSVNILGRAFQILDASNIAYNELDYRYTSPNLYPDLLQNPLLISDKNKIVMRTDRLPSSDVLDGIAWDAPNVALLQQNINFALYEIIDPTTDSTLLSSQYPTNAQQEEPDIEGQLYASNVLESFNCSNMVSLDCYTGFSNTFGISQSCAKNDQVENGCYVLFTRPLIGLTKDLEKFDEWGTRYKLFYGICRGVLSQTFTNNWVNGTLFAFPIQVDTYYDRENKPSDVNFCKDLVFFEDETSNFYYRSSPYIFSSNKFVGKSASLEPTSVNDKNLLFPTTIIDLGYKDSFYDEITLDPSTNAFILDNLNPTSYSDTSDIINLFVISRILNSSFLERDSIQNFFTRNSSGNRGESKRRVDGDLAQMMSINSEEGVIKFSPEFYSTNTDNSPVGIYGTPTNPTIGIFFSSTTENLQFKDFITPGRINFRSSPTANSTPYYYGIKTQEVPFYKWSLQNNSNIFGTELNNWATNEGDILQYGYQSLDRVLTQYFKGSGIVNDQNMRGYIFNVSNDTVLSSGTEFKPSGPSISSKFLVGAPFHFYFGTIVGATALEKFKEKYGLSE